jgi:predicted dehydrogenase
MERTGIAVVGCGSVACLAHFPSISRFPALELVAVYDPSKERAEKAVERWGGKLYGDYEEMLQHPGLRAVIIASPNVFHFGQARAALNAGKHVYLEKPMCATNREAWALVELAKKRELKLTVGCNQRFWLQHAWAKEMIDEGIIGKVRFVRSSLHETWHLYQDDIAMSDYRMRPEQAVSGTLFDQGSHRADLVMWLAGGRPKRVVGMATQVANPDLPAPMDDLSAMLIEFDTGSYGMVTTDKFSPVVSNITEIYGTEGTIFASSEAINPFQSVPLAVFTSKDYDWETLPERIKQYRYPSEFWVTDLIARPLQKKWISITPPREWSFTRMMDDFLTAILDDRQPLVSGEDGAHTMEMLCGVFRSMETKAWVDLPLEEEVISPYMQRR